MFFKNLAYTIALPFKNLTTQARIVQIYRLVSGLIALIFVLVTLLGSFFTRKIYIARIDCSHIDVSLGLYESLRTTVSSNDILELLTSYYLPQDQSLTDSEIKILTAYAQEQVASAPQFITSSLWNWCHGNYNITSTEKPKGKVKYNVKDIQIQCMKSNDGFGLDYKDVLSNIGLDSIIAYAYSGDSNDEVYQKKTNTRRRRFKMIPASLIFCTASQVLVFVLTFLVYSNRGSQKDLSKIHPLFLNIIAYASLASCLSIVIGAGIITNLLIEVRNEISGQLNSFGISLHLGLIWFLLLWIAFAFSFLSMTLWAFPIWCANPSSYIDDEEFATYNEHLHTVNRAHSTKSDKAGKIKSYNRYTSQLDGNTIELSSDNNPFIHAEVTETIDGHEDELRKLGETLSRKPSVRHIPRSLKSKKPRLSTLVDDETVDLLYNEDDDDNPTGYYKAPGRLHYQEETFDGYTDGKNYVEELPHRNLYSKNDIMKSKRESDFEDQEQITRNERVFQHNTNSENTNIVKLDSIKKTDDKDSAKGVYKPYLSVPKSNRGDMYDRYSVGSSLIKRQSWGESILNDEEMNILDLNDYVERLDR